MNATVHDKIKEAREAGKVVYNKYFNEYYNLYDWLQEHKEYKMVDYNFTFAYGYCLFYVER